MCYYVLSILNPSVLQFVLTVSREKKVGIIAERNVNADADVCGNGKSVRGGWLAVRSGPALVYFQEYGCGRDVSGDECGKKGVICVTVGVRGRETLCVE